MDNTKVLVYGSWKEGKRQIADSFDWKKILSASDLVTQYEYNPDIFQIDNKYNFSAHGKEISVHTMGLDVVGMSKKLLAKAVSEYYNCTCFVSGDFLQITVSLLKKNEEASHGIRIGDIIEFGRYRQENNSDAQPIRWNVLNVEDDEALLITEDCMIMSGYCDAKKGYGNLWYLMWGNCLAREVCNGQFYHQAFDHCEKDVVKPKHVIETVNGPDCRDEVFLLSEAEAALFMEEPEKRRAKLSLKLRSPEAGQSAFHQGEYTSWWLLPEEMGHSSIYPKAVLPDGEMHFHGRLAYYGHFTIRPCILIDLERYDKYLKGSNNGTPLNDVKATKSLLINKQADKEKATSSHPKISGGPAYSLPYIQGYEDVEREHRAGGRSARHDISLKKWRLTIQLDDQGIWFLTVFVNDDGSFDKFSLDYEMAEDSHYEFSDEKGLRKKIYRQGDEKKYLAEVLISYVKSYGGIALLSELSPFITAQFHYY